MARLVRIVIPTIPHHITQRGNRSQNVFFSDNDKASYIRLLHKHAQEAGISFLAYCLMDNHVHLIAVPEKEDSLAKGISDTHKYYTRMINFREKWRKKHSSVGGAFRPGRFCGKIGKAYRVDIKASDTGKEVWK